VNAPQAIVHVSVTDSRFEPETIRIDPGTTVRWTNNGRNEHRVRDSGHDLFDSDDLEPGDTFDYTFNNPGYYPYEDADDDFMGMVIVGGSSNSNVAEAFMVRHDRFYQETITVTTGTTVKWTNLDGELHSTSSSAGVPPNDAWISPDLNEGGSYTKTFLNPGTYNYFCTFHADEMFGKVVVTGPPISPTPGGPTSTPASGTSDVTVQNNQYAPKDHVVSLGSTVRWTNKDSVPHTITSDTAGQFSSPNLGQNGTYEHTFTTAGRYAYHCAIHPGMTGSITVQNGDGSVPTAGPSNTPTMTRTPQPTNTPGGAPMTDVSVVDFSYSPATINVQQGATVRWTNNGAAPHTVSSVPAGQFESGNMNSGQTFQFTFNTPGTYNYKCAYHSNMTGTVNVLAPGSTPMPQPSNTPRATSTPMSQPSPGTANVAIRNYAYDPKTITVNLGDKVIWTGFDTDPHSVTSMGEHAGLFDSGEFGLNGTYERVFDTPGTYKYYCTVHGEFMSGTVIVQGSGGRFADVAPSNTFYPYIVCLADRGVIGGYSDGTYRPSNPVTRGQLAKIIANSAGFGETPNGQTFADVAPGSPFYEFVERIASRNIISGYACGGPGEPCGAGNKPYFRPGANASRGQIAKIVAGAANLTGTPSGQTFADVPTNHTFYTFVEQLAANGSMSGYPCGGTGEQCDGQNRPYFRPSVNTTRGQLAKIVSTSFFPECGF
jgi:plastocyanin